MEDGSADELADLALTREAAELLRLRLSKRGLAVCLSGIDGSGKSTLARELVQAFETSGVPVRYLHLHQWYLNVSMTPALLLYNRYIGGKVLVFDRSIYDNIAVASVRRYWPRWLSRVASAITVACYPKFDHCFYLVVDFAETLVRRPDTDKKRFVLLREVYGEIVCRAPCMQLQSDAHLFEAILRKIVGRG